LAVSLSLASIVAVAPAASAQSAGRTSPAPEPSLRKIIVDEDSAGPGGTAMQTLLLLINSPQTQVLGVTVVTGDAWRDEEVQHALRLLEIIGRTDIPVVPGAVFPIVNSKQAVAEWEKTYGKVTYQGAWNYGHPVHGPWIVPRLPEGSPITKPRSEDAPHFLLRMVRKYPHEVTIYAGGPLTNLALAQTIDPRFASLAKELVLMGGSLHPVTTDPEFRANPHREFNLWMDPEASRCVLRASWPRIVVTTVDISVKTRMDKRLISEIAKGTTPSARYVAKYASEDYLWDELAATAWLDPSIITKWKNMYLDVSIDHGATYGNTLAWDPDQKPALHGPLVEIQEDLDRGKFYREFVARLIAATPHPLEKHH
jgi:purine nucleosidase